MAKTRDKLDSFFKITERKSSIKVELYAGITTFLAMAYILTTNPIMMQIGQDGARTSALLIATAFGAIVATVFMAIYAKLPYALAPGMGINAMVGVWTAFGIGNTQFSYTNIMTIVFLSGLLFLLVSFIPCGIDHKNKKIISLREKIFDGIPEAIRFAIPAGIGLFIAFIGLQNAGIIVLNDNVLVGLVDFGKDNWEIGKGTALGAVICLVGLIVIAILSQKKVKGAILYGILAATLLAIPLKIADTAILKGEGGVSWAFWESFGKFFSMNEAEGSFGLIFKDGFNFPAESVATIIIAVITLCMINMFDTIGTVVGISGGKPELLDGDGIKPLGYSKIMQVDSSATCFGAIFGTSTITTFVESGAGVEAGGRTGLTSLMVAGLFILSIFVLPIFAFIPKQAAASALIFVGVLMMGNVTKINFYNIKKGVPAFMTIVIMPLAYSITDGIGIGIITYTIIELGCYLIELIKKPTTKVDPETGAEVAGERPKLELNIVTIIIAVLFVFYFIFKV